MRYNRVKTEINNFYAIPDDAGVFHRVYESTLFFETKQERNDFEEWLSGPGGDLFAKYRESQGHEDEL